MRVYCLCASVSALRLPPGRSGAGTILRSGSSGRRHNGLLVSPLAPSPAPQGARSPQSPDRQSPVLAAAAISRPPTPPRGSRSHAHPDHRPAAPAAAQQRAAMPAAHAAATQTNLLTDAGTWKFAAGLVIGYCVRAFSGKLVMNVCAADERRVPRSLRAPCLKRDAGRRLRRTRHQQRLPRSGQRCRGLQRSSKWWGGRRARRRCLALLSLRPPW